jgi:hypothetical protein
MLQATASIGFDPSRQANMIDTEVLLAIDCGNVEGGIIEQD